MYSPVQFSSGEFVPLEMHKVRVVQKLSLLPVEERLRAIESAGFNTFLLQNRDVFLDMLTDSGTNAMSDQQVASMAVADDAYVGSESYARLYENRQLVGGLEFYDEPKVLRFFVGRLRPKTDWTRQLLDQFRRDFPAGR